MKLTDGATIDALLGKRGPTPRMTRPRPDDWAYVSPKAEGHRCRCGRCRQCHEDAKWERIFQEKFADPSYYTDRRLPRGGSSLNQF